MPSELVSFMGWPQYGATGEHQQLAYWDHYRKWSGVPVAETSASFISGLGRAAAGLTDR